jgi:hypothetical protein
LVFLSDINLKKILPFSFRKDWKMYAGQLVRHSDTLILEKMDDCVVERC